MRPRPAFQYTNHERRLVICLIILDLASAQLRESKFSNAKYDYNKVHNVRDKLVSKFIASELSKQVARKKNLFSKLRFQFLP